MMPDNNYDPFSAPPVVQAGSPSVPRFTDLVSSLNHPSFGGGSPPSSGVTPVMGGATPSTLLPKEPVAVTSEVVVATAQSWSLETVEEVKLKLAELADNKRYRDILVQKLQQRMAITNPVNDQVMVLLADVVSPTMPFVLESRGELTRLLQSPTEVVTVRRASAEDLVQILHDWYEQITNSYLSPVAEWANWLMGEPHDEQSTNI